MKPRLIHTGLINVLLSSTTSWAQSSSDDTAYRLTGTDMLWQLAVIGLFIYGVTTIVKTLSDNRVKKLLIEKGLPEQQIKYVFGKDPRMELLSALKYGFLSFGIGAGLVLNYSSWPFGIITFGLIGVGAALGFLLYALVAGIILGKSRSKDKEQHSSDS
jgi:hypothetical protein